MGFAVIGLTGGIACGKSAAASRLREHGAFVVDADQLARDVTAPGQPAIADIARAFPDVIHHGTLDRARLGARVFSDTEARRVLELLLHPRIAAAAQEKWLAAQGLGHRFGFYEAALLVETGAWHALDALIVVTAPREVQRQRLMARNQLTAAEADARIDAQMPVEEKARKATWVLSNEGTLASLFAQTDRVFAECLLRFGG